MPLKKAGCKAPAHSKAHALRERETQQTVSFSDNPQGRLRVTRHSSLHSLCRRRHAPGLANDQRAFATSGECPQALGYSPIKKPAVFCTAGFCVQAAAANAVCASFSSLLFFVIPSSLLRHFFFTSPRYRPLLSLPNVIKKLFCAKPTTSMRAPLSGNCAAGLKR